MYCLAVGDVRPEILTKDFEVSVERCGTQEITCKTRGSSNQNEEILLTWWYQKDKGEKKQV